MLLRSSSTPVLGSLLSSVPESPNNNHYETPKNQCHNKLSFQHSGSPHFSTYSCSSSPAGDISQRGGGGGGGAFRRAQSDGNLQALSYYSSSNDDDHFRSSNLATKKLSGKPPKCLTLETIPSFSSHNLRNWYEEEESEFEYESDGEEAPAHSLSETKMSSVITREDVELIKKVGMEENNSMDVYEQMYLAKGLGIGCDVGGFWGGDGGGGGGGGGGGECYPRSFSGDGGNDGHDVEDYYKRMVQENPGNPLFLRNYAKFLYQTKHDLEGAEEYYSRAIIADPGDGEILTHYAKLVWELHHDQDRASSYFERAVQASPEDCHVHAAYASFLWDVEDEDDVQRSQCLMDVVP